MSSLEYAVWPFRPFTARSAEDTARWWEECYLPGEISSVLPGWQQWRVIVGGPGSGKSVALEAIEQLESERSFIIPYPPERWPGGKQAFVKEGNHLAQIMANAALIVPDFLTADPAQIKLLTPGQRIFVRWLLDKFMGRRAFSRWVDSLTGDAAEPLRDVPFEDIYPTTNEPADVHGQIDELVSLTRRLGFQRVLVSADLNTWDAEDYLESLQQLFEWLELMHHAGLSLIVAVPAESAAQADLTGRAKGRVSTAAIEWSVDQVREIAARHISAATSRPDARLEDYVEPALLIDLEAMIQSEFSGVAPLGWVMLAETVLHLATWGAQPPSLPLTSIHRDEIVRAYFSRHMPLQLVAGKGFRRGPRLISLDERPLLFAEILCARPGGHVNVDDPDVQERLLETRKGNKRKDPKGYIHTLAHRVRQAIEPDPANPIYLLNDRGEGGYWIENAVRSLRKPST